LFVNALSQIHSPETVQYLLSVVHHLLSVNQIVRCEYFNSLTKRNVNPYSPFLRLLHGLGGDDPFILNKALVILALLFSRGGDAQVQELTEFMQFLNQRLAKAKGRDSLSTLRAIKDVLKNPEARLPFLQEGGLKSLTPFVRNNQSTQSLYVASFCVWLISYNKDCLRDLQLWEVVPKIADVLKVVTSEKVVRVSLSILRNLLNESNFNEEMISCGIAKSVDALQGRKWKDEDVVADLEAIKKELDEAIVTLSSFEKYQAEVLSGRLEWTPVHSEQFWRENNTKFEEKSFALIKSLIGLLETGTDLTMEVACYDLGEFARFHPDGKRIIQQNRGKLYLMDKMSSKKPQIARQALLAVQKLMVQNWDFFSRAEKKSGTSP